MSQIKNLKKLSRLKGVNKVNPVKGIKNVKLIKEISQIKSVEGVKKIINKFFAATTERSQATTIPNIARDLNLDLSVNQIPKILRELGFQSK